MHRHFIPQKELRDNETTEIRYPEEENIFTNLYYIPIIPFAQYQCKSSIVKNLKVCNRVLHVRGLTKGHKGDISKETTLLLPLDIDRLGYACGNKRVNYLAFNI